MSDIHESIVRVIENCEADKPSVWRTVKVVKGRKHVGKVGIVRWHGKDKFDTSARCMTMYQSAVSQAIGKLGYRVQVETESGDRFFVSADYVEIVEANK